MTREQARAQALAVSGAVIITYVGIIHVAVGASIWPWAPAFVGGEVNWYVMGVVCIAFGLALVAATLRLVRLPVLAMCAVGVAMGVGLIVLVALVKDLFHFYAASLAVACVMTAYFHRKAAV